MEYSRLNPRSRSAILRVCTPSKWLCPIKRTCPNKEKAEPFFRQSPKGRERKGSNKPKPAKQLGNEVIATIEGESDRGAVLVALAEIDNRLESLLLVFLDKFGPRSLAEWVLDSAAGDRPLNSLCNRSVMACCLGLIDEEMLHVIDALRTVRNKRAHSSFPFELTEADIADIWAAMPDYVKRDEVFLMSVDGWSETYGPAFGKFVQCAAWVADAIAENEGAAEEMLTGLKIAQLTKSVREGNNPSVD